MDFPSQPLGDAKPGAKEHDMQLIHSSPADSFRGRQVRMWTNPYKLQLVQLEMTTPGGQPPKFT